MDIFRASHSHLFPGAVLTAPAEPAPSETPDTSTERLVIFSDESTAEADLTGNAPADLELAVQPYTTAAGTRIDAKTWRLVAKDPADRPGRYTVARSR